MPPCPRRYRKHNGYQQSHCAITEHGIPWCYWQMGQFVETFLFMTVITVSDCRSNQDTNRKLIPFELYIFHGLVQDCCISSVLAMEIQQHCTEPSILWYHKSLSETKWYHNKQKLVSYYPITKYVKDHMALSVPSLTINGYFNDSVDNY